MTKGKNVNCSFQRDARDYYAEFMNEKHELVAAAMDAVYEDENQSSIWDFDQTEMQRMAQEYGLAALDATLELPATPKPP